MNDDFLSSLEVRALTEAGFHASANGDLRRARTIFKPLLSLRAERASPYIGLALAYMNTGKPQDAVALFERATQIDEAERDDLAFFHALALQMARRAAESDRMLAKIDTKKVSKPINDMLVCIGGVGKAGSGERGACLR